MGTRALQVLMIALLAGFLGWASAIFFGPWALTKYLESQVGDAVEVSGLKVTPKLAVTARRVQMLVGRAVSGSLRGVELDWRLFFGDGPAVLISVASVGVAGSLAAKDLQVTLTQAESSNLLKISGTVALLENADTVSMAEVKFDAHTDYNFQLLRRMAATTGALTTLYPERMEASNAQIEVDQFDLGKDLLRQDLSGTLALTDLVIGGPGLSAPEVDLKFALSDGLISLAVDARDLHSKKSGVAISDLTGNMEYDAARALPAGPIDLALKDFAWKDIQLPAAEARIALGDEQFKVSAQGVSLGSEITLGRRYIGRVPDASFNVEVDVSEVGNKLTLFGRASLAAAQKPVELDLSFRGAVADVSQLAACMEAACEVSDVIYEYNLGVAGETLSGTSRCLEPTCSEGVRRHELSTTDTNKFFANLQEVNMISPLVLGGAYAQMLQGAAVGTGHKINF